MDKAVDHSNATSMRPSCRQAGVRQDATKRRTPRWRMLPRSIGSPGGCFAAMGSERLQGLSNAATHQGWLVRIDMLTQGASQVAGVPEPRRWFVPGRRCCGYWNYLATVRAVNCDVPLVRLNGFTHRLPRMMPTLQRCIEPWLPGSRNRCWEHQPDFSILSASDRPLIVSSHYWPDYLRRSRDRSDCALSLLQGRGRVPITQRWGEQRVGYWGAQPGPYPIHIARLAGRPLYVWTVATRFATQPLSTGRSSASLAIHSGPAHIIDNGLDRTYGVPRRLQQRTKYLRYRQVLL
jgi:hypothetical protein